MERAKYIDYVRVIFRLFAGCGIGEGLYFFRSLDARKYDPDTRRILINLTYNLIQTGYLTTTDYEFLKLTERGYAYMQDGDIELNNVDFDYLIKIGKFNALWCLIGREELAPFYISGPDYYNTIKNYLPNIDNTCSNYIGRLKSQGKPTSRSIWYKELFNMLPKEQVSSFATDLSKLVAKLYATGVDAPEDDVITEIQPVIMEMSERLDHNKRPTVFISYSYDSDSHKKWIMKLVSYLRAAGIDVLIDQDLKLGTDLDLFMEESVSSADRVILILTPTYKKKADERAKGVGYESSIITAELYNNQATDKFIPVFINKKEECYPRFLGNRLGLDMSDKNKHEENLLRLIDDIKN